MKYLAAYLLLNAAGTTPSADSIKSVLESVGIEIEDDKVSSLLTALEGKSVEELIAEGNEKLASVPTAGPAGAASGASGAAAGGADAAEEEAAEEEAEESDEDMGFGLFD
ncbi:60S ribosomal protein P2-alpha [Hanseniaspora vineae]